MCVACGPDVLGRPCPPRPQADAAHATVGGCGAGPAVRPWVAVAPPTTHWYLHIAHIRARGHAAAGRRAWQHTAAAGAARRSLPTSLPAAHTPAYTPARCPPCPVAADEIFIPAGVPHRRAASNAATAVMLQLGRGACSPGCSPAACRLAPHGSWLHSAAWCLAGSSRFPGALPPVQHQEHWFSQQQVVLRL